MTEVSREYSGAVYMLAAESGSEDEYSAALAELSKLLRENPGFIELLASPCVSLDERCAVIDKAFSGGEVIENIASFLKILTEKGHIRDIFDIIDDFEALRKSAGGISTAAVTSAVELTGEETSALTCKLEKMLGHKIELKTSVDPSLIGGMVVRVDGKVMDGSVKGRLNEIGKIIK